MPIAMPKEGRIFFPFCARASEADKQFEIFPSYAHLITIAAAVGLESSGFDEKPELLDSQPLPIGFDTFRSLHLDGLLLALSISWRRSEDVAKDESLLCRTVEGLAAAGFSEMKELYLEAGNQREGFPSRWQEFVKEKAESTS